MCIEQKHIGSEGRAKSHLFQGEHESGSRDRELGTGTVSGNIYWASKSRPRLYSVRHGCTHSSSYASQLVRLYPHSKRVPTSEVCYTRSLQFAVGLKDNQPLATNVAALNAPPDSSDAGLEG